MDLILFNTAKSKSLTKRQDGLHCRLRMVPANVKQIFPDWKKRRTLKGTTISGSDEYFIQLRSVGNNEYPFGAEPYMTMGFFIRNCTESPI